MQKIIFLFVFFIVGLSVAGQTGGIVEKQLRAAGLLQNQTRATGNPIVSGNYTFGAYHTYSSQCWIEGNRSSQEFSLIVYIENKSNNDVDSVAVKAQLSGRIIYRNYTQVNVGTGEYDQGTGLWKIKNLPKGVTATLVVSGYFQIPLENGNPPTLPNPTPPIEFNDNSSYNFDVTLQYFHQSPVVEADNTISITPSLRFDNKPPQIIRNFPENPVIFKDFNRQYYFDRTWGEPQIEGYTDFKLEELSGNKTFNSNTGFPNTNGKLVATNTPYRYQYTYKDECSNETRLELNVLVEKHYPPRIRGPVEDGIQITHIDSNSCTVYYLQPYLEVLDLRVDPPVKDTIQLPTGNHNALGAQTCPEPLFPWECSPNYPGYADWCNTTPDPANSEGDYSGMPDPNCSSLTQWYYTDHENHKGDLYRRTRWNFKYTPAPLNTQTNYYYKLIVGPWLLANPDTAKTTIGNPTNPIRFLRNDLQCGTGVVVVDVEQPQNGQVTVNGSDGNFTFTYQPNPDFGGRDTFKYTICNDDTPRKCASSYVAVNVTSDYNLSIQKTINTNPIPASLNENDEISYKITVSNIGVRPIENVFVLDTIRNMLIFQNASRNHTEISPNVYRFDLGTIAPERSVTFTITCKVKSKVAAETYNSAIVSSDATYYKELPILKSDNYSIAPPIPINSEYNLTIKKVLNLTSIEEGKCDSIGQAFNYTITVTNTGLKDISNATIIDTLPRGTIFLTAAGTGTLGSTNANNGNGDIITWKLPAIPKDGTATVIFSVQGIMSGTWINKAHVRGFIEGTTPIVENMTDNVSSATVIVPNALNPYIHKTVQRSLYNVDDQFMYTIKLGNRGKEEGKNIVVRDTLPPQLAYVGKTLYNENVTFTWDAASRVVTYKLPILRSQMVDSFKIEVRALEVAETVINRVKLEMEQNIEYPVSQCILKIVDGFDLGITIDATPKPAMQGELITYTITVTNYSARITNGNVKMELPDGLTYISDSENAFIEPLGKLEWRINRLNIGESKVLTLICRAKEVDEATVTVMVENQKDEYLDNNTASIRVLFTTPPVDLKLTKSTTQPRTYWLKEDGTANDISIPITIKIENRGTDPAKNVTVIDTLPANFTVINSSPSATSTMYGNRSILKWNLGTITSLPYTITFNLSYPQSDQITCSIDAINRAWVTTTDLDPNLSNNTDTCTFSIVNDIDLWIEKTSDKPTYNQGEIASYLLKVENKGRKPSAAYTVKDILPEGFTPQNITPEGIFDENARTITWNNDGLVNNGFATFSFTTEAIRSGTVMNTASVVDPIGCERQVKHQSYVQSGVELITELAIQNPKRFIIGEKFTTTYTIKNNGTYPAKNVRVTSQLPTQLLYPNESETPAIPGLFINKTDGSLLWNISEVPANGEQVLTLDVQGDGEGENILVDYLAVTNDGKEQNAFDEVQIIVPPYDLSVVKTVIDTMVQSDDNVPFTYTITVQNTGTDILDNIVVTDTLPNNMIFKNTIQYKGNVTVNNNIVQWNIPDLGTFEEQTLELTVTVRDTGKYVNSAVIFSNSAYAEREKNKLNNRSTVTVYAISGLQRWNIMQIFTPNGDGKNDKFVIRELEDPRYSDNEIVIFNRYGSEVFYAKPYNNDWSGGNLKNDTYFYHLRINITGSWVERKGFIQLKK